MRQRVEMGLAFGLAVVLGANALAMLLAGSWWYAAVPGVVATGPYNAHFVMDIGAAYLVCAAGLSAFAAWPVRAFPTLVLVVGFLGLHAAIHLIEALGSPACGHDLVRDLPSVFLPALISAGLVASRLAAPTELGHA